MRLAVLADIHGNLPALEVVLADLAARRIDRIINLGDCVSGPLWPAETCRLLVNADYPTVRGNHDRWVATPEAGKVFASDRYARAALDAAQCEWLGSLPSMLELPENIVAFHGTPTDDNFYLLENVENGRMSPASHATVAERLGLAESRLVLCAHSHQQAVLQLPDGPLIVNPGSVGCPAYADPTPPAHVSEARSPHARYAVLTIEAASIAVDLVAIDYDWKAAARRATENESPGWARALLTGFM